MFTGAQQCDIITVSPAWYRVPVWVPVTECGTGNNKKAEAIVPFTVYKDLKK